jgi:hypothetical protein
MDEFDKAIASTSVAPKQCADCKVEFVGLGALCDDCQTVFDALWGDSVDTSEKYPDIERDSLPDHIHDTSIDFEEEWDE